MENIILSLLLLKNMTIYEIKTCIEKNMSTICSSSIGSIQTAIKKLLLEDCIEVFAYEEKSMIKKEYRIKEPGREKFEQWIQSPMNWYKAKNMEEGKFFFMGMLTKEDRIRQLTLLISQLKQEQLEFKQLEYAVQLNLEGIVENNEKRISKEPVLEQNLLHVAKSNNIKQVLTDVSTYQWYMLQYALERIETDIRFFSSIIKKERDIR